MISVGDPPVNGMRPVDELEEHDAERKEIRALIDRAPERLLRRHVRHRADDHSSNGHLRLRHVHAFGAVRLDEFRETEVEHLHEPALGAHQVGALDIAMHDAAGMRFLERVGHLQTDLDDFTDRQRSLLDARRQQLAFDVLHDDEVGAGVLANVVGDGDVWRTQQRRRTRLVEQARPALRIGFELGGQELQRDRTAEADIFGAINLAHAAGAKALADAIVLNSRTNEVGHGYSGRGRS